MAPTAGILKIHDSPISNFGLSLAICVPNFTLLSLLVMPVLNCWNVIFGTVNGFDNGMTKGLSSKMVG